MAINTVPTESHPARPPDEESAWHIETHASLQAALDAVACPPPVRQALSVIYSWQFRNETPIRRALTAPRIAPQFVAALLACGARVTVESSAGSAEVPLDVVLGRGGGERPLVLHVPGSGAWSGELRWGEAHVSRSPADEPIVAAWAVVALTGEEVEWARVALTGVWAAPAALARAAEGLAGGPLDEARIRAVAGAVEGEVAPQGDYLGSPEYRRAMAGVLARRALMACWQPQEGRNG